MMETFIKALNTLQIASRIFLRSINYEVTNLKLASFLLISATPSAHATTTPNLLIVDRLRRWSSGPALSLTPRLTRGGRGGAG